MAAEKKTTGDLAQQLDDLVKRLTKRWELAELRCANLAELPALGLDPALDAKLDRLMAKADKIAQDLRWRRDQLKHAANTVQDVIDCTDRQQAQDARFWRLFAREQAVRAPKG